ncbi:hypothetical protein [uncultured Duncaniella sp.]|uniref:hypothetical protein n=2 Tax=uncultured Duncaniella sp. TaxID=2768039 RepID=UPI0025EA39CD|nr:hypothetical protein [uncultured Duncaniella sp.]
MKSFGKGLFWIGFILLMGVVIAYMIIMFAGIVAFTTWTTSITICAIIIVSGLLMLVGRTYERKGEEKHQMKELENAEKNNTYADPTTKI